MTCSSPIKDKYFHEEFSQSIVSNPKISSCSDTNFADMSNICFIVRSFEFLMECQLSEYFFPMNTDACSVEDMNIPHITECSSLSSVASTEDCFCHFCTWSFTLFKNDLDPNDNSDSDSSFPMTNCSALAPRWGQTTSLRSIMSSFFFRNNVLGVLMRETWLELVCPCPRGDNGLPRSIIHRFISFPLLRRPSFVIFPPWVECWVRTFNKFFVVVHWLATCVTVDNGLPHAVSSVSAFALQGLWHP